MSDTHAVQADQPLRDGKVRDRALVLPLVGVLLLISPLAGIFQLEVKLAGVPFTLIYLFSVWALLIICAVVLSRRLRDGDAVASQLELPESNAAAVDKAARAGGPGPE